MTDCTDVCDIVMEQLHYLGFEINDDDESHDDILAALAEVNFTRKIPTPKPLAQYLAEYLATGIDRTHEAGMPVDYTEEGLKPVLEQALDAYESTEQVKIKIERK